MPSLSVGAEEKHQVPSIVILTIVMSLSARVVPIKACRTSIHSVHGSNNMWGHKMVLVRILLGTLFKSYEKITGGIGVGGAWKAIGQKQLRTIRMAVSLYSCYFVWGSRTDDQSWLAARGSSLSFVYFTRPPISIELMCSHAIYNDASHVGGYIQTCSLQCAPRLHIHASA